MRFSRFGAWILLVAIIVTATTPASIQAHSSNQSEIQQVNEIFLPMVKNSLGRAPLPPSGAIIIDHRSVEQFERIPDNYIRAASEMRMFFMNRSVGQNIYNGLECLRFPTDEAAPTRCRRWNHTNPNFSVDPATHGWSRPGGYDSTRWDYKFWPSRSTPDYWPYACDTWSNKVRCFIEYIQPRLHLYDVVSFQYSYLEVSTGSTIANMPGGFFSNHPNLNDVFDYEAFASSLPAGKQTFYWTTSLARGIGTIESETFNNQMRQYAAANNKVLFDVADILSHDPNGNPCFDNRGRGFAAICPHYTTNTDGGHLGTVSAGKIRVAKAFWVLMARLAGWQG